MGEEITAKTQRSETTARMGGKERSKTNGQATSVQTRIQFVSGAATSAAHHAAAMSTDHSGNLVKIGTDTINKPRYLTLFGAEVIEKEQTL